MTTPKMEINIVSARQELSSPVVLRTQYLKDPTIWRIHLGAHKTATTHMQRALARKRRLLRKKGIDYLNMRVVRNLSLPKLHREFRRSGNSRHERRQAIRAQFYSLRRGGGTVAFSEENLLGTSQHLLKSPIYPRARAMARFLSALEHGDSELRLFLGLRSWDTLLPSAYAEMLRRRPPPPGGFDEVRALVLTEPPRWSDLIARLKLGSPKAALTVWRYEDYADNAQDIARLFLGVDPGPMDDEPRPRWRATPSAAAVAEAEALNGSASVSSRVAATREVYTRLPAETEGKFQPFTEAERTLLREAYEEDLARIEARWPSVSIYRAG